MTVATGKRVALSVFGAAGLAATVLSAVLVWAMVTGPDHLAMAMNDGSVGEIVTLAVRWVVALLTRALDALL